MDKPKIILLNGCSSAGKSSLAKALQHLSEEPWLTFAIDTLIGHMPDKFLDFGEKANLGFHFISTFDKTGFPITEVKVGPYGKKVSNSAPKIVKQLAGDGHNLIIDEVIWERSSLENYVSALKKYQVYYIKVNCELPITEEREILRGDRPRGMARWQFTKMRDLDWNYDYQVDTTNTGSFANARKILQFLKEKERQN
ncbi:MAG: chloramphenicol phosphotransferase [Candidatus Moeniiplasma glomeromycotorum]|nr:chloramphenicol phosphotransferase [Candidatus Moeniiplasma glomeromycotorum]MCE8167092.1 chloramphenicol phosphotransferase [Candidatus Moeniiplasma glomeromycotorum]MCE8168896.1 chloramphenicol phosphotransferase [Candidatus Moeniiplasma glomeromycotorum]